MRPHADPPQQLDAIPGGTSPRRGGALLFAGIAFLLLGIGRFVYLGVTHTRGGSARNGQGMVGISLELSGTVRGLESGARIFVRLPEVPVSIEAKRAGDGFTATLELRAIRRPTYAVLQVLDRQPAMRESGQLTLPEGKRAVSLGEVEVHGHQ